MGYQLGKITAPVSISDVRMVLGVSSDDVGYLCSNTHKKINKWAKHKPVSMPQNNTDDNTCKGVRGDYGLSAPATYTSKAGFMNAVASGTAAWKYTPPQGGASSPYRLTDFAGYNHFARSPFGTLEDQEFTLSTIEPVTVYLKAPPSASSDSLTITDLSSINGDYKEWYLGVALKGGKGTFLATATEPIKTDQSWKVDFGSALNSYPGTYQAVPFLSNKPWTAGGSDPTSVLLVGIEDSGAVVVLNSQSDIYKVSVRAYFDKTNANLLHYTVTIQNTSGSERNFPSCAIQIATSASGAGSRTVKTLGIVTVAAGQTKTLTGSVTVSGSSPASTYSYAGLFYTGITAIEWQTMMIPM